MASLRGCRSPSFPPSAQSAQGRFSIPPYFVAGVLEQGRQRLHGPPVADLAERLCSLDPHLMVSVLERGDERIHGPGIADFTQGLGGLLPRLGMSSRLQDLDQTIDIPSPFEEFDVEFSKIFEESHA